MTTQAPEALRLALLALESTIRKNERVVQTLQAKSPPLTTQSARVEAQLKTYRLAHALVAHAAGQAPAPKCTEADRTAAIAELGARTRQIEALLPKFTPGTPQHTLAIRRIDAFRLAQSLLAP